MHYVSTPTKSCSGNLKTAVAGCNNLNQSSPNFGDLNQSRRQHSGAIAPATAQPTSLVALQRADLRFDQTNIQGNVGIAGWNATDNAGKRILGDTNLNVSIYVIGYTGSGGSPTRTC